MAVSSGLKVTFTEFESAETSEGNVVTVPWNDFAEMVVQQGFFEIPVGDGSEEAIASAKKSLPLIIPAEFSTSTNRKTKAAVERVWMGALDYDERTAEEFREVVDRIISEGLEAILYTTWGHAAAAPLFKFRVIIPLSRAVRRKEWDIFWRMLNNLLGGLADEQCKDPNRGYFAPGVPEGTDEEFKVLHRFEGDALDVNKTLSGVDTLDVDDLADIEDVGKEHIDRDRVKRFARKLVASQKEYVSWMGTRLMKMVQGEPFAEKGERDNTTYKMAQDLGKAFPHGDADSLASLFAQSLSQMGSDGPQVGDVREKIQRAQREEVVRELKEEKVRLAAEQQLFESSGAPEDYDREFIQTFCRMTGNGCNPDLFQQRLIVQRNTRYYVFSVNTYWPYARDELTNACRDLFKPAENTLGANVYNVSDRGLETPKSAQQLVHDYGVVAKRDEIRIWANATYYEEDTQTLVEAPYPPRGLSARRHETVDRWIDDICGYEEMREALRDWLAVAPNLMRPLAMLVFIGETGVGKTSFAKGLSRIWTTRGYTDMQDAFKPFNTGLKESPVLLADEALPRDFRGRVLTEGIRSLISSDTHQINEKNRNLVPLRGYFRTIAALQNREQLAFGGRHTKEDIAALQARLLIIHVQPGAQFDYESFVNEDALAEHALYLRETRHVADSRFGIAAQNTVVDILQDTFAEEVLDWIMWFVEGRQLEDEKSLPIFVSKGKVYLSSEGLSKFWTSYYSEKKDLSRRAAGQVLRLLTDDEDVRVVTTMGVRRRYFSISGDLLQQYGVREGLDVELLMLRLQVYTENVVHSPYVRIPRRLLPTSRDKEKKQEAEQQIRNLLSLTNKASDVEEA